MPKFMKKPVVIEAVQLRKDNLDEIAKFIDLPWGVEGIRFSYTEEGIFQEGLELIIPTLEGDMTASEGDWIIKGIKGEFYPCKPDIFEDSYILVPDVFEDSHPSAEEL